EMDAISGDHPIVVFRTRGIAYLNSPAFKAVGVNRETKILDGRVFQKDSAGEPEGLLDAPNTVIKVSSLVVPPPTLAEQKEVIQKMQDLQLSMGWTSVREVEIPPDVMRAYWSLWREG